MRQEDTAAVEEPSAGPTSPDGQRPTPERDRSLLLLTGALVALVALSLVAADTLFARPGLQTWTTVFTAIVVQAMPFLVLGVTIAAAVTAFVPPTFFARVLPRSPVAAVPVAGVAGLALPGCECASVPIAGGLVRRGVLPAAALTFLLAAPAINPVVLVSTAVAFPGQPEMWVARLAASLGTAIVMGWLWVARGRADLLRLPGSPHPEGAARWVVFTTSVRHDLLHAGGFLVLGAMIAAAINTFVPTAWMDSLASQLLLSVLVMAVLAVLLALCSESDAFVAASFNQFSPTAQLAFMVVGPMVDVKLVAMQAGTFGRAFVARFAPATFVVAVLSALAFGGWLL